ncbi:MAG: molecular chaperone TorD family protein [Bacteroidales bacterium]
MGENLNLASWIDTGKHRATAYQLLSFLFCQPEKDLMHSKPIFDSLEISLSKIHSLFKNEATALYLSMQNYSYDKILIAYSHLFLGPFKTPAPPYSSVYLGKHKTLFGEETLKVMDFYRRSGLQANREAGEVPDHIAIELEFVYYLIYHQVKELEVNNLEKASALHNIEIEFKTDHLNLWVPVFCDKILAESQNKFYTKLGSVLKLLIKHDRPAA